MKKLTIILALLIQQFLQTSCEKDSNAKQKQKSFSVFNLVQFQNNLCTQPAALATTTQLKGTCFTADECAANGGTGSGSCASGFGICCVFTASSCGSIVSRNETYIQNQDFPSLLTTATSSCAYIIAGTSDICQIRLDFETMVLGDPTTAGACSISDQMKVTSSSGSGVNASPPVLCGTLTGSHMYVETGRQSPIGAMINIASSASGSASKTTWRILVTQYECSSPYKAPTDCVQYYVAVSNNFTSFNYKDGVAGRMLQSQNYHICIRQVEGYCSIRYSASAVPGAAKAFSLGTIAISAQQSGICITAAVIIPVSPINTVTDVFCGNVFNGISGNTVQGTITSIVTPFQIGVFSFATDQMSSVGFRLHYKQLPC